MTCKDYKFYGKHTVGDTTKYVVWAELYSSTDPAELPTNAVGIEGFPQCYPLADVEFEVGSYIYVVSNQKIYVANESHIFV